MILVGVAEMLGDGDEVGEPFGGEFGEVGASAAPANRIATRAGSYRRHPVRGPIPAGGSRPTSC